MNLLRLSGAVLINSILGLALPSYASASKPLVFESRVKAQEAIEQECNPPAQEPPAWACGSSRNEGGGARGGGRGESCRA